MLADGRERLEDDAEGSVSPPNGSPPHERAHNPHVAHAHLGSSDLRGSSDRSNGSSEGLPAPPPLTRLGVALPQQGAPVEAHEDRL